MKCALFCFLFLVVVGLAGCDSAVTEGDPEVCEQACEGESGEEPQPDDEPFSLAGKTFSLRTMLSLASSSEKEVPESNWRRSRRDDEEVRTVNGALRFDSDSTFELELSHEYRFQGGVATVRVTGEYRLDGYFLHFEPEGYPSFLGVGGPALDDLSTITLHAVADTLVDTGRPIALRFSSGEVRTTYPTWAGSEQDDSAAFDLVAIGQTSSGSVEWKAPLPVFLGRGSNWYHYILSGRLEVDQGEYSIVLVSETCVGGGPGCANAKQTVLTGPYVRAGSVYHFLPTPSGELVEPLPPGIFREEAFGIERDGEILVFGYREFPGSRSSSVKLLRFGE